MGDLKVIGEPDSCAKLNDCGEQQHLEERDVKEHIGDRNAPNDPERLGQQLLQDH